MTRTTNTRASWLVKALLVLLATVLVTAACGGDDNADDARDTSEVSAVADVENGSADAGSSDDVADAEAGHDDTPSSNDDSSGSDNDDSDDDPVAASNSDIPRRIVSISPTGTEMLFAVGAGDRVVAVDEYSYFPQEAPVTDLSGWNPNIEAIASYAPDLVVVQTGSEAIVGLEALGIEVFSHDAPVQMEDVYDQIEQLGAVTGQEDEAAQLNTSMQSQIAELIAVAPDASGLTYYHELDNTLYSVTSSTFVGGVYSLFGLSNVADAADADGMAGGYPQLSDEYLLDEDPDIIFLADTKCCGQTAQTVAERPGWDQLTAVQMGRVVELDDDVVSRWGPRLVNFVEAISEALVSVGAAN